jgi:FHIPEP family
LTRVWHTSAPHSLHFHTAPLGVKPATAGFRDAWLRQVGALVGSDAVTDSTLCRFLADLTVAAISDDPRCLLSDDNVGRIADEARGSSSSFAQEFVDLEGLVRFLVSLGVSVADRGRLREAIEDTLLLDLPLEDRRELIFERLRASCIGIRVHPHDAASLGAKPSPNLSVYDDALDERLHEPFRELEKNLFLEHGLRLPQLVWVTDTTLDPHTVVVVVNDLPSLPLRVPETDQLLVEVSADSLPAGISGQDTYVPATGGGATLVPAALQSDLESSRMPLQTWVQSVADAVANEAIRRGSAFLAVGDVTYQVSALSLAFPNLVDAALAKFSLGALARVLRGLLDEGVSIRDLRLVLDRLLDFETVPVEDPAEIVLDRRLAIPTGDTIARADWQFLLAFVRAGLADDLARDYADDQGRLDVFTLESELEDEAARIALERDASGLDAETGKRLRDALWARLPTDLSRRTPILLVSTLARRVVRDALACELPQLGVLAHPEVKPGVKVKRLETIRLDNQRRLAGTKGRSRVARQGGERAS